MTTRCQHDFRRRRDPGQPRATGMLRDRKKPPILLSVAATFCPTSLGRCGSANGAPARPKLARRGLVAWVVAGHRPQSEECRQPQFDPVSAARVPGAVPIQGCCRPVQAERSAAANEVKPELRRAI